MAQSSAQEVSGFFKFLLWLLWFVDPMGLGGSLIRSRGAISPAFFISGMPIPAKICYRFSFMKVSDLHFEYPEELIATEPQKPSRVLWFEEGSLAPAEISLAELLKKIPAGDLVVLNDTKVLKSRVFADDAEILFLKNLGQRKWEVLFPAKKMKIGEEISLPLSRKMKIVEKGRPQIVETDEELTEEYFEKVAELPLPPYIQKARGERKTRTSDLSWYQTTWAEKPGSLAAPTASLHFSEDDIQKLKDRGVKVAKLTLHVGLGTFLPILTEDLNDHVMHEEYVEVPLATMRQIEGARQEGRGIWALGTTVCRALESVGAGILKKDQSGHYSGFTNLKIQPGFQWKFVNRLMTNFHQPESTLFALVVGFSNLDSVRKAYAWAMERKFRLFSYGDLTVWIKK